MLCRVLTPRPYVTAAVVEQHREAAALTIQRLSRGWFARKRAGVLRDIKAERDAFLAETAAESAQAVYNQKRCAACQRLAQTGASRCQFAAQADAVVACRDVQRRMGGRWAPADVADAVMVLCLQA